MEALEAIKGRRSVRDFRPDPVPEEALREIVEAARLAPSANNVQPWEFVVVRDRAAMAEMAAATDYGGFIASAPACIAVFCKDTRFYLEDGAAAVENALIAATALGLGGCWVAGDKKAYAKVIRERLGAPASMRLVALIALGYPRRRPPRPTKRRLEDVLHWERF